MGVHAEATERFDRAKVEAALGGTPLHCFGAGEKFVTTKGAPGPLMSGSFATTCKKVGHFEPLKLDKLRDIFNTLFRRTACNEGGATHRLTERFDITEKTISAAHGHFKQATSYACFGPAKEGHGKTGIAWEWPHAKKKGAYALKADGVHKEDVTYTHECEHVTLNSDSIVQPTFTLRAHMKVYEGSKCEGKELPGDVSNTKDVCIRVDLTADVGSGNPVPAELATLKAYTRSRLSSLDEDLGIDTKVWGTHRLEEGKYPYWVTTQTLNKDPQTFNFTLQGTEEMSCEGPIASDTRKPSYKPPSKYRLKQVGECQFTGDDKDTVDFGRVGDEPIKRYCTFVLDPGDKDGAPVNYQLKVEDEGADTACFDLEVQPLSFTPGKPQKVFFNMRSPKTPKGKLACNKTKALKGGWATYKAQVEISQRGNDIQNFHVRAESGFAIEVAVAEGTERLLRENTQPISWQGRAYNEERRPLRFHLTFQSEASTKASIRIDPKKDIEIKLRGESVNIPFEAAIRKDFGVKDRFWRPDSEDETHSAGRWIECNRGEDGSFPDLGPLDLPQGVAKEVCSS